MPRAATLRRPGGKACAWCGTKRIRLKRGAVMCPHCDVGCSRKADECVDCGEARTIMATEPLWCPIGCPFGFRGFDEVNEHLIRRHPGLRVPPGDPPPGRT